MQAILGYVFILLLAWAVSERRGDIPRRAILAGIGLHIAMAVLLLTLPAVRHVFLALNDVVHALQQATLAGTSLMFGYIGGGAAPFDITQPGNTFVLAFQALPLVLLMSALAALLYHWRILPMIVQGFAWCLKRTLGVGGTAGVSTAANVFVGMVEAPLLVKPYLQKATRANLFIVMAAGMATIAGTVMVLYATFLKGVVADPLGNLLIASILNAPAAIVIARLMIPPEPGEAADTVRLEGLYDNSMDAVTQGASDGIRLLLNITGMVIVVVALVALLNAILGLIPAGDAPLTLQAILGFILAPFAWLLGIPWAEAQAAGSLLGTKVVVNEFLAYLSMGQMPKETLSEHSRLILTYALCGFANFQGLGIMLGGMAAMAPERRKDILSLGMRSILAGFLASCMTAALAGLII